MVGLFPLHEAEEELEFVEDMVRRHVSLTGSKLGWDIVSNWRESQRCFVRVYPNDFRRVLEAQARVRAEGVPEDEVLMAAFQKNLEDRMRAGGN
jgi:glutamate synthase (ferredoxin)